MSILQKEFSHPELGRYKVVKRKSSKSMRLTINSSNLISVSIPWYTTYKTAISFVESKKEWIISAILKQKKIEEGHSLLNKANPVLRTLAGDILLKQETITPNINTIQLNKPHLTKKEKDIIIKYNNSHSREEIIYAVEEALRKKAREYLPQRTERLAIEHNFRYNKVYVKKNRSNWGSCSSLGNINLNIHLTRLPKELCDYVIIHELAHLVHRNHGKEFHDLMNNLTNGRNRTLSSMLKEYRPRLY